MTCSDDFCALSVYDPHMLGILHSNGCVLSTADNYVSWCFSQSQAWLHNHDYKGVIDDGFSILHWTHYFHLQPNQILPVQFTAYFQPFILYPKFVFILVTEWYSLSDFMFECMINLTAVLPQVPDFPTATEWTNWTIVIDGNVSILQDF